MQRAVQSNRLISAMLKCRETKDQVEAKRLYAFMRQEHLESDPGLGNYLVPLLVACGSLHDAQQVFDHLPCRKDHSWTSLISAYVDCGDPQRALLLFRKMQEENSADPTSFTFVTLFKACAAMEDAKTGRELHIEAVLRGLERDVYVGSTVVHMYGKCGFLAEARHVIDRIELRNAVSWTALIAGYSDQGFYEEVLKCFKEMQQEGVCGDLVTLVCSLKACGTTRDLKTGHELHAEATGRGMEKELYVGSALVDMYAKCDSLAEAHQAFEQLSFRDTVTWNSLISGYADHGLAEEILNSFRIMEQEGLPADAITYVCSLKACGVIDALEICRELHTQISKFRWETDLYVGGMLVDTYSKCGSLTEACCVFDLLPVRNAVSWTAMIAGYAAIGIGDKVLDSFKQMQLEGASIDCGTFVCSLKSCGSTGAIETGRQIHIEITKWGLERDLHVGSTLVDMYAKCFSLAEAHQVLKWLPLRNAVSWTALVAGYAELGVGEEVIQCLEQMQLEGVIVDAVTFASCLKGCTNIETGREIHTEIIKRGLEREIHVGSTLVDMYSKCGSLAEASQVFNRLPVRNAVSWTALIAGYAEHGYGEQVLSCFTKMQQEGVHADAVMFIFCLKACGIVGALDVGRQIHAEIRKSGLESDLTVGHMLIEMYGKCGSVAEGREVFDNLPTRNVISWTLIIRAYGENHEGNVAIECFEEMLTHAVKPNSITFTCLLAACSHASLVLKGQEYFSAMKEQHEIKPTMEHYACMVDLYARSGHIYEAERLVAAMEDPPSSVLLMALLSACKIYGKVELGEICCQLLVEVNEEDAAAYLLMADIYASAGRWTDANRLEERRKDAGAKKRPGSTSIEVNKRVHEFGVNEREEITEVPDFMSFRMKGLGYIPEVDMICGQSSDEEKDSLFMTG